MTCPCTRRRYAHEYFRHVWYAWRKIVSLINYRENRKNCQRLSSSARGELARNIAGNSAATGDRPRIMSSRDVPGGRGDARFLASRSRFLAPNYLQSATAASGGKDTRPGWFIPRPVVIDKEMHVPLVASRVWFVVRGSVYGKRGFNNSRESALVVWRKWLFRYPWYWPWNAPSLRLISLRNFTYRDYKVLRGKIYGLSREMARNKVGVRRESHISLTVFWLEVSVWQWYFIIYTVLQ